MVREPKLKLYGMIHAVRLKADLSGPAGEPVLCTKADQPWETPPGRLKVAGPTRSPRPLPSGAGR